MTPTAISTDAKASPRGPAGAGSATASAGPDFDGVLTSLRDGGADADDSPGTQGPTAGETVPTIVAPRLAGDGGILSMLVDKAASANETGSRSKGADRDDNASSQPDPGQAAVPLGLMSMLIATAAPSKAGASETSASEGTAGGETRRVAEATDKPTDIKGVDPVTAGDPKASEASLPMAAEVADALPGVMPDIMKSSTDKPPSPKASNPIAAGDTEAGGATIQSVSVSTQIAPSSAHGGQLAIPSSPAASADADAHRAPVERTSAPTAKAETSMQDVATSAMPTIARIADAISDLADAPAPAAASAPASPTAVPVAPARTMVLQLAPADLGTVAVRLHLTGQTLDVQLSVSDPKTLGLVSRERDALAARLDDRGYQLNALVIQGTDPSTSSTAGSHDTSHNGAGAGTSADRDQGAEGGRRGASGQTGRGPGQQASGDSGRGDASVDGRGGLYI